MANSIDKMIEDGQAKMAQLQNDYNQKVQEIQQIQQESNALSTRINTLTEVRSLGENSFRELDETAAHPETEAATERPSVVEEAQAEQDTVRPSSESIGNSLDVKNDRSTEAE